MQVSNSSLVLPRFFQSICPVLFSNPVSSPDRGDHRRCYKGVSSYKGPFKGSKRALKKLVWITSSINFNLYLWKLCPRYQTYRFLYPLKYIFFRKALLFLIFLYLLLILLRFEDGVVACRFFRYLRIAIHLYSRGAWYI